MASLEADDPVVLVRGNQRVVDRHCPSIECATQCVRDVLTTMTVLIVAGSRTCVPSRIATAMCFLLLCDDESASGVGFSSLSLITTPSLSRMHRTALLMPSAVTNSRLADDEDEGGEKRRQKRGSRHSMQLHTDDTSASPDQLAASDDAWGWPARCLTVIVKRNTVSRSITSCCRKCSVTICRRSEPRAMQSYHIDCETYCRARLQLFMPQTRRKVNI